MSLRTQVDLMQRCVYGIVHPDDHHELKTVLEGTLSDGSLKLNNQRRACCRRSDGRPGVTCRTVSFLIRIKCFNGTTTGYLVRKTYFRLKSDVIWEEQDLNHKKATPEKNMKNTELFRGKHSKPLLKSLYQIVSVLRVPKPYLTWQIENNRISTPRFMYHLKVVNAFFKV